MGFPKAPPLGSLRLAMMQDVPRIATVATAGFYYSPVFAWERRFHSQFPLDTMQAYEKMFADVISDPQYIAIVATDAYDPKEHLKSGATIVPDVPGPDLQHGDQVVAGVATWKLQPGSSRVGQFMPPDAGTPSVPFDGGRGRDKSMYHADLLDDACDDAKKRYFDGHQLMDMVVVHPAYWGRGHGSKLVKWGMALADTDQVEQGVIAADIGEKLYLSLNYRKLDEVVVGDKLPSAPPHDAKVGVLRYSPKSVLGSGGRQSEL